MPANSSMLKVLNRLYEDDSVFLWNEASSKFKLEGEEKIMDAAKEANLWLEAYGNLNESESHRPLFVPKLSDDHIIWYGLFSDISSMLRAKEELGAFVQSAYAELGEFLQAPGNHQHGVLRDAVAYILEARVIQGRERQFTGHLVQYRNLLSRRPRLAKPSLRSFHQIRRDFDLALAGGQHQLARSYLSELKNTHRLDHLNLHYLTLRMYAGLGLWQDISNYPDIKPLLEQRLPIRTQRDIIEALYHSHIKPYEAQTDAPGMVASIRDLTSKSQWKSIESLFQHRRLAPVPIELKSSLVYQLGLKTPDRDYCTHLLEAYPPEDKQGLEIMHTLVQMLPQTQTPILPPTKTSTVAPEQELMAQIQDAIDQDHYDQALSLLLRLPEMSMHQFKKILLCCDDLEDWDLRSQAWAYCQKVEAVHPDWLSELHNLTTKRYLKPFLQLKEAFQPAVSADIVPTDIDTWVLCLSYCLQELEKAHALREAGQIETAEEFIHALEAQLEGLIEQRSNKGQGASQSHGAWKLSDFDSESFRDEFERILMQEIPDKHLQFFLFLVTQLYKELFPDDIPLYLRGTAVDILDAMVSYSEHFDKEVLLPSIYDLTSKILMSNPTEKQYVSSCKFLIRLLKEFKSLPNLDYFIDLMEIVSLNQIRNLESATALYNEVLATITNYCYKLLPFQWDAIEVVGQSVSASFLTGVRNCREQIGGFQVNEESENEDHAYLKDKKIGIYTLDKHAGSRAVGVLEKRFPEVTFKLNHDTVSTEALVSLSKTADEFIFSSQKASHAAFYCVSSHFNKEITYPKGKGTTSMIRVVEELLRARKFEW